MQFKVFYNKKYSNLQRMFEVQEEKVKIPVRKKASNAHVEKKVKLL